MSAGHGHGGPPGLPLRQEVADGVFAHLQPDGSWWLNNAGFLVGGGGVVAIDTAATVARTSALRRSIREVTDLPVRTLVNTHHHGDHTHGNAQFPEATIVASAAARRELLASGSPPPDGIWSPVEWGDVVVTPPTLTFSEGVDLWLGDERVEVRHIGVAAHTVGDAYVWLPERGVLFTGDLAFNGGTPFVLMGSVVGALDAVATLRGLGAATVVPGHGAVGGPEVLDPVEAYLRFVLDVARAARAAGVGALEAARSVDLGAFAELTDSERLVGNLHRAFADLRAPEELGAPIDVVTAIGEMVAFNGGPLTCWA